MGVPHPLPATRTGSPAGRLPRYGAAMASLSVRALAIAVGLVVTLDTAAAAQAPPGPDAERRMPGVVVALQHDDGSSRIVVADATGPFGLAPDPARVLTGGAFDVAPVVAPEGVHAAFVRLAAAGDRQGRLGFIDLTSGQLRLTGIPVDRFRPLLWESEDALIATTDAGVVRIFPELSSVEFVAGTVAGQVAHDVLPPGPSGEPSRVLVSHPAADGRPLRLLEMTGGPIPRLLWRPPEVRYTIDAAAYGPKGSVALVSTLSSIGFGGLQHLSFMDPEGDVLDDDAAYGGDGPVNLMSGPFWRPQGGAVLFGGSGTQRFAGLDTAPATLLQQAPGSADRVFTTRDKPTALQALGWSASGDAAVALTGSPDGAASVLRISDTVVQESGLPGRMLPTRFGTPNADLLPPIRRLAGLARTDTAAGLARATFPASREAAGPLAPAVVLARADDYADALAGAPLARHLGAPLLLTSGKGLDPNARAEIERLGATRAVLLGGRRAIGAAVEQGLEDLGVAVERVAGPDRFATAAAVAERLPAGREVVLVEGADADPSRGWPDAVAASVLAAAEAIPLLLVTTDALPEATAGTLAARAPEKVTVVGGSAAVSPDTAERAAAESGAVVERVAGGNRVATAVAVAREQMRRGTGESASLWLATARNWPDALTAGPAVAADGGVLLLVPDGAPESPPDAALEGFLADARADVVRVVGGEAAIGGAALRAQIERLAFRVTPEAIALP